MTIKQGDFVRLNYTGKLQDGTVFDTTVEKVAKEHGLETKELSPVVICVGQRMLIPGLDEALLAKKPGSFSETIKPEGAFGKKDPKLLRIVPTQQLRKQNVQPRPGMQLNIDGSYGVVRSTGGGRTVVDFNHPLASQEVTYDVEILEIVQDPEEQVRSILRTSGIPFEDVTGEGDAVTVRFAQMLPQQYLDAIQKRIVEITALKTVSFEAGEQK